MIKKMTKQLRQLTFKLYSYAFFDDFLLIYPLYALFMEDSGLGAVQISSLFIVWSAVSFLLEVPSGALADKYPRKNILLIGILAKLVGFGVWLIWPTYWGFLIGFVLWGVKTAFSSGTEEALVYDELSRLKNIKQYSKVLGRMEGISILGLIMSGLGASLLSGLGYNFILILSIVAIAVSGLAVAFLPKSVSKKPLEDTKYLSYLKSGVSLVLKQPLILLMVVLIGALEGISAIDEYFNLLLREKGLTNAIIAACVAFIYAGAALGSVVAYKLVGKKLPFKSAFLVWALLLFGAAIGPAWIAVVLFAFYMFCFSALQLVLMNNLQAEVGDRNRATATSVSGFLAEVFGIVTLVVVSIGASHQNYAYAFKLVAILVTITAFMIIGFSRKLNLVK